MKKKVILAMLLVCAAILAGCHSNAAPESQQLQQINNQPRTITEFLEDEQIPYQEADIVDRTLTIRIPTDAKKGDTSPLELTKAYYKIYEAAYAGVILGDYNDLCIEAVNDIGVTIFDWDQPLVKHEKLGVDNWAKPDPRAGTYTDAEIKESVQEIASKYGLTVGEIQLEQLGELIGKKLDMTINCEAGTPGAASLDDFQQRLSGFALSSKSISCCNIAVNNRKGMCLYNINIIPRKGEFCIWIHPSMQAEFAANYGPPSE